MLNEEAGVLRLKPARERKVQGQFHLQCGRVHKWREPSRDAVVPGNAMEPVCLGRSTEQWLTRHRGAHCQTAQPASSLTRRNIWQDSAAIDESWQMSDTQH